MSSQFDRTVETLAVLADPVRRAMYRFVRSQPSPVSRERVAEGTGTSIKLAAFHLEKLLERGLLQAHYQRPGSRPEGGRPAKLYERARREISLSLPGRRYDVMAEILAGASAAGGEPVRTRGRELAYERGRKAGEEFRATHRPHRLGKDRTLAAARDVLDDLGFETQSGDGGEVVLTNCPFESAADRDADIVCGLNEALVSGVVNGLGGRAVVESLERAPSRCCVVLRRPDRS
ncbi:MAG: transcriptional regulator [Actinomycetota bacterium]|nr:transcriptional regulator [Actinomycetota bacterium]